MYILGISCYFHDSAITLIRDGEIIFAIQEERLSRKKHDSGFPFKSISKLLEKENISIDQINEIVFYDKPLLKFDRLIETYLRTVPRGIVSFSKALPIWINEKIFLKKNLVNELIKIKGSSKKTLNKKIKFSSHHLSHAASAFYPSPYENAIIITVDGVGEWSTTTLGYGSSNKITIDKEINFPHSLGLLYSAFTQYIGFKVNTGEYKLMGLAPYGNPRFTKIIKEKLIKINEDGSYRLNMRYFDYMTGLRMINKNFENLFNVETRVEENESLNQFHMDIAASIQVVIEEALIKIINYAYDKYKCTNLCLAGGVALNCVANGKIIKNTNIKNLWIQPASGDSGGSLGAALLYWYKSNPRKVNKESDSMKGSYLGFQYDNLCVESILKKYELKYEQLNYQDLVKNTALSLSNTLAVGWFQGRSEFGPRSLGNRSILADPRSEKTQKSLNEKIKFRESFRPFAPSIILENLREWFDLNHESPYMLIVDKLRKDKHLQIKKNGLSGFELLNLKRSEVPAITHIDYSARIQTVNKEKNKIFYDLISSFYSLTNVPILVNTSFNVRGEPIVESPEDAVRCFLSTNIDILVVNDYFVKKSDICLIILKILEQILLS